MDSTLLGSLLRDELRICGDAVEDFSGVGAHHAWTIYCPNNRKPKESPQNERVAEASLRAHNPRHDTLFVVGLIGMVSLGFCCY